MKVVKKLISFVLISVTPLCEHEVYLQLLRDEKIAEVNPLFGEYDLIIKIDTKEFSDLGNIIQNIRKIECIIDTKTLTGTKF